MCHQPINCGQPFRGSRPYGGAIAGISPGNSPQLARKCFFHAKKCVQLMKMKGCHNYFGALKASFWIKQFSNLDHFWFRILPWTQILPGPLPQEQSLSRLKNLTSPQKHTPCTVSPDRCVRIHRFQLTVNWIKLVVRDSNRVPRESDSNPKASIQTTNFPLAHDWRQFKCYEIKMVETIKSRFPTYKSKLSSLHYPQSKMGWPASGKFFFSCQDMSDFFLDQRLSGCPMERQQYQKSDAFCCHPKFGEKKQELLFQVQCKFISPGFSSMDGKKKNKRNHLR